MITIVRGSRGRSMGVCAYEISVEFVKHLNICELVRALGVPVPILNQCI